jgi:hypothetical protein
MKKTLLLTFFLGIVTLFAYAQMPSNSGKFSIGFETGFPVASTSDTYWLAIGASMKYEKPVNPDLSVSLSVGYTDFNFTRAVKNDLRESGGNGSGENFVPIKVGFKHFFDPEDNMGFFAEMQVGGAISTQKDGGTAFIAAPGAGYEFESGFEAGLRYEGWFKDSSLNQIGVRLAYNF